MMTRTHVHYFGEDQTAALRSEYRKLRGDAHDRIDHIPEPQRTQMLNRLENLRIAIDLLEEAAD